MMIKLAFLIPVAILADLLAISWKIDAQDRPSGLLLVFALLILIVMLYSWAYTKGRTER